MAITKIILTIIIIQILLTPLIVKKVFESVLLHEGDLWIKQ